MYSDDSDHYSSDSYDGDETWLEQVRRIKEDDPHTTRLRSLYEGDNDIMHNLTEEGWEQLGMDISNNTHLTAVDLGGDINDQMMSWLFRGLTRSSSINDMRLYRNGLSVGVRSMFPFLQNTNITYLDLGENNIQSTGFNELFRALRNTTMETLRVNTCNIEAIEIDSEHIPQNMKALYLYENNINSGCCLELAKLLKEENATLQTLSLEDNKIDDEGVEILIDALKSNTSLTNIYLTKNDGISVKGMNSCLRLVNDISSINATLKSNHTLESINVLGGNNVDITAQHIQSQIDDASQINKEFQYDQDRVGNEKIIQTQLNSVKRKALADTQGVSRSLYSEIDPMHLPEVLALVGRRHGEGDLYVALKSSIAGVISTVNKMQCLKQKRAHHEAMIAQHKTELEKVEAEIVAIYEADGPSVGSEHRNSKRRRAW